LATAGLAAAVLARAAHPASAIASKPARPEIVILLAHIIVTPQSEG
jgi:hypothetical protein